MSSSNTVISLEELKDAITRSYPGIEQQLLETFVQHDIAGDGQLPYSVVEPLLRHFFVKCGLGDYVGSITDSDGKLIGSHLEPYLGGTSLEGITSFSDDRMVTLPEMSTMAVVWLKIISDVYQSEDAAKTSTSFTSSFCCGSADFVTQETAIYDVLTDENGQQRLVQEDEGMFAEPQYTEHINDEIEEEEIKQKNMENYIQTLVNETAMNRNKGVKCYVYSAATTPGGTCVSAGAAVPQRRPRPKDNKKPTAGCC